MELSNSPEAVARGGDQPRPPRLEAVPRGRGKLREGLDGVGDFAEESHLAVGGLRVARSIVVPSDVFGAIRSVLNAFWTWKRDLVCSGRC